MKAQAKPDAASRAATSSQIVAVVLARRVDRRDSDERLGQRDEVVAPVAQRRAERLVGLAMRGMVNRARGLVHGPLHARAVRPASAPSLVSCRETGPGSRPAKPRPKVAHPRRRPDSRGRTGGGGW